MHVALDRGGDDEALGTAGVHAGTGLLGLDVGDEVGDGLLHHASGLHHLGEEHLAGAEEVTDDVHAVHERALDDLDRGSTSGHDLEAQLLGVGHDVVVDALDQGVGDALPDGIATPLLEGGPGLFRCGVEAVGDLEQSLGGVGTPVEDDVLDAFAQLGIDLVVDHQGTGIDDAHVHAGADRVVKEDRVDRLAHGVVAPEGEGDIGDAAGDEGTRQVLLDPADGLDVVGAVGRVLLDAGRDGEDVGVEDDVLGGEAHLVDEQVVRPLADRLAALEIVGLTVLVEGHDHHGGTVLAAQPRLLEEGPLALLHGDRVDDALALCRLEPLLDDLPLRGVDHEGDLADVGLTRDELDEAIHGGDAVDHPFVHVDVDDLGSGLDLLTRDGQRRGVVLFLDELAEAGRPRDVGPLADVDEERVLRDHQGLQPGQAQGRDHLGGPSRAHPVDAFGHCPDVVGRRAAAATEDVDEPARGELLDHGGHLVRGFVVFAEGIGQAGVGIGGHETVRQARQLRDIRTQLVGAECTVEADGQGPRVPNRIPEGLRHLA